MTAMTAMTAMTGLTTLATATAAQLIAGVIVGLICAALLYATVTGADR